MGFTRAGGSRVALLPISAAALGAIAAAAGFLTLLVSRGATVAWLPLLSLVVLPWLPFRVPSVCLLWLSPLVVAVWVAVVLILARSYGTIGPWLNRRVSGRPALAASILAFCLYSVTAWQVSSILPAGDEPHYLVITQSLLYDRDLQIENNHRRGDYHAYFSGELRPDFLRRGRNGQIYSIHAPGLSALVLPAFAVGGYRGVVVFLIALSSLAAGLAWRLARRVSGDDGASWFGWAAVVLAPTVMLNAFTVYPDGAGAAVVLTGVWALVRTRDERLSGDASPWPWLWHGAALALLPWLHTRFAVLAAGFGALVLLRLAHTRNAVAKACAFLALPAASAILWLGFFTAIYGAPDPGLPYRGSDLGSPHYIISGLAGLFFDQQYGLFVYAPVLAAAIAGLAVLASTPGEFRWLGLELTFVALPYTLVVTHFGMWWGGFSAPARFLLPLVPALAIPVAVAWAAATRRGTRAVLAAALAVTGLVSAALVFTNGGGLAYHGRETYARWLQWLSPVADLQHALPSFFAHQHVAGRHRTLDGVFYVEVGVWLVAAVGSWLAIRALAVRRPRFTPATIGAMTAGVLAGAAMVSATFAWVMEGVDGTTPEVAGLNLLRASADEHRSVAVNVARWQPLDVGELPGRLTIETMAPPFATAGLDEDRPVFALPPIPAGDYRLAIDSGPGAAGSFMVGIGRDEFAIMVLRADALAREVPFHLPVDVRSLVVRGDEEARRRARTLRLRPASVLTGAQKAAPGRAVHGIRYGPVTAYFMDDRSFPEATAFWVSGSATSSIVLQPDTGEGSVALILRNAPVTNRVEVQAGRWKASVDLGASEERRIEVPLDTGRGATQITFTVGSGFRPSAVDPHSRDERFLGVSVRIEGRRQSTGP